jgi:hypothetical protein
MKVEDSKRFKANLVNSALVTIKELYSEFNETIDDELRELGFVRLKPGQVVAERTKCYSPSCDSCQADSDCVNGDSSRLRNEDHQIQKLRGCHSRSR